ncbi:MAG TPA: hypothetical protein VJM33_05655 [Microthrixaceae bacterium]|nr:hypothetical protein [Microthrixaceae bacterium]
MAKAAPTAEPVRTRAASAAPGIQDPMLVEAPTRVDERCGCGETLVRIDLLIDGDDITMRSCSVCDRRRWHRGGEQVELRVVLADLSSSPTRYRRDLASR